MAGSTYIADPADQLKAVPLDGLTAIFHRPSGITHLLAPPAPQILEALADRPADAEALIARISERFDVEGGADALAARLAELEAAGLVRRA
jgi:PqqD family protein of HPr-rel-A system